MPKKKRTTEMQIVPFSPKRSSRNNFLYLSEETIFDILSRVPAESLQHYARYVCKSWSTIPRNPDFVRAHLLRANSGLYLQHGEEPYYAELFEMKEMKSKVVDTWWDLPGEILDSCDGILLICKSDGPTRILFLANPVTMQVVKLPRIPTSPSDSINAKLARINDGKFRVIFFDDDIGLCHGWYILTVDSQMLWRKLPFPYLERAKTDPLESLSVDLKSICIHGISYWIICYYRDPLFFAIDLNDESSRLLQLPCEVMEDKGTFLSWEIAKMGNHLCCVVWYLNPFDSETVVLRETPAQIWLWKLIDLHQNTWVKTHGVNLFHAKILRKELSFYATYWDDQESLIFHVRRRGNSETVALNMRTGKAKGIGKVTPQRGIWYGVHTNSLVSF
ncbi:F-box-like domain-containing protein [Quillaja saponaria]|uniref:F-box-like domain-containing protein n=1 Tax=Quillaja saponaria TaxID=32244 RepID=A0AAD7Q341_QUISA|nr:F-box-like domain-containing protein [Quillaja saponaria]